MIPSSGLFAAIARRRRARYAADPALQWRLRRPVISVGSLSIGGSGKTPLVALVARVLREAGHRPAILSRGYARPRPVDGAVVVSDGARVLEGYRVAGDEPLMLARQLPGCAVIVSPDRYLAGALAERRLGCTLHILDDGFQHLRLARTLDIVIVTERDLNDRTIPRGRLREPLTALRGADAVIVNETDGLEQEVRRLGVSTVFRMRRRLEEPRLVRPWGAACDMAPESVTAFAGIAHPDAFFDELERAGWRIASRVRFADHHPYSDRDLLRLSSAAERDGAALLVTTEKDAVRLEDLRPARLPIAWMPLSASVEPAAAFEDLLRRAA